MLFLDSLKMHQKGRIAKKIRQWLNFECGVNGVNGSPFNERSMELITPKGKLFFVEIHVYCFLMSTLIDFYCGLVPLQTNGCDCGVFVCRYAHNLYCLRDKMFTKSGMQDKFRELITRSPAFQFTMDDISGTREEMKILVDSLSVLYKHVQQNCKQMQTQD